MIQASNAISDKLVIPFSNLDQNRSNEKSSAKVPFNFGKCKVCKDKATGIHYGIPSCEGCKGFFKRSVEKNEKYVCYFGFKCTITPKQRKRCKYCRWKACLAAGMSFEGIKMGRIPKIEKERAKYSNDSFSNDENDQESDNSSPSASSPNSQMVTQNFFSQLQNTAQFPQYKISENLNYQDAYNIQISEVPDFFNFRNIYDSEFEKNSILFSMLRDYCYQLYVEYTEKYEKQYSKALRVLGKMEGSHVDETIPSKYIWESFLQETSYHTKTLYMYAKKLPGFDSLCSNDFLKIINSNIFIMFGLRTHKLFINDEHFLIHPNNIQFNRNNMYRILGIDLTNRVLFYHSKLNSLNLTDKEISLLKPYLLTATKSDFVDPEAIRSLNEYYKNALMYEFSQNKRTPSFIGQLGQYLNFTVEINTMAMNLKYIES